MVDPAPLFPLLILHPCLYHSGRACAGRPESFPSTFPLGCSRKESLMTALREKMLADLQLRNYSQHTIDAYLRQVAAFARHFGKSPDRLGPSQVRDYQLFLVRQKRASWPALVQAVAALRFFYRVTLGRKWMVDYIPHPRYVKPLPTVLSQ